MSFMGTLAKVAVGFAAAKGLDRYQKMGGMAGIKSAMGAQGTGSLTDGLGEMAEKMGLPGGKAGMADLMSKFGLSGNTAAHQAGMAGLGGLMSALGGAGAMGGSPLGQLFGTMSEENPMVTMGEENAKLLIRAMIQAAKADGEIDPDEQAKIIDHLGDDATEEEIAFVRDQLAAPVDFAALAQDTSDAMKAQVYSMSLMAIRVDNAAEQAYLGNLATALGLSDQAVAGIHSSMGTQ